MSDEEIDRLKDGIKELIQNGIRTQQQSIVNELKELLKGE